MAKKVQQKPKEQGKVFDKLPAGSKFLEDEDGKLVINSDGRATLILPPVVPPSKSLWASTVHSPALPRMPKEAVTCRMDVPLKRTLESMAGVLGKAVSYLAGEILRVGIIELHEKLNESRPDLRHAMGDGIVDVDGNPVTVPNWIDPQAAYALYVAEHPESVEPEEE